MKILAIETSCDETSIALIERLDTGNYRVHAHETISQINLHREFGGVYPTLSRREHEKNLIPLLHKVLLDSKLLVTKSQKSELEEFADEVIIRDDSFIIEKLGTSIELLERYPDLKENVFDFFSKYELIDTIDYIAVTNGPGLPPALWVGVNFAKVVSILLSNNNEPIPLYPINHMEGHIVGGIAEQVETEHGKIVNIPKINYPAICLLISGGHTEIVLSTESGKYEKIGETQDDAVGEAFDKVARLLGLPYPGGPEIGKLAKISREHFQVGSAFPKLVEFPRPMIHSKDLNFSFSGLKTHILYLTQRLKEQDLDPEDPVYDYLVNNPFGEGLKISISGEFEEAVKDVLIYKTKKAIEQTGAQSLIVGGGVASNMYLKENFEKLATDEQVDLYYSAKDLATDNALMIALTCANQIENGVEPTQDFPAIGSKNYEWK